MDDVKEPHRLTPSRDFLKLTPFLCTLTYLSTNVLWVAVSSRSQFGHCFYLQHTVQTRGGCLIVHFV